MAEDDGGPMYCLMSARSTNARSMAPVMFDVARMMTLGNLDKTHHFMMYQLPQLCQILRTSFYNITAYSGLVKSVHFNPALTSLGSIQPCCMNCMSGIFHNFL